MKNIKHTIFYLGFGAFCFLMIFSAYLAFTNFKEDKNAALFWFIMFQVGALGVIIYGIYLVYKKRKAKKQQEEEERQRKEQETKERNKDKDRDGDRI